MTERDAPVPGDAARVTVFVRVPPAEAFRAFVEDIDTWWRRGPRFRAGRGPASRLAFEPGPQGRLLETDAETGRAHAFGSIRVWEPPHRLAFTWRGVRFAPDEVTLVELTFTAVRDGTEVRLVHRGWGSLRDDHPARHGRTGPAFAALLGRWWGDLLSSYRETTD